MKPRFQHLPIVLLLLTVFIVGCLTVNHYGESWDEPDIYRYGEYSLNAYQYLFHPQDLAPFDTNLNYYGPAYFMIVASIARGATDPVTAWHFTYFVTFLIGVAMLYFLSRRWLSTWAAFGVALLFLTQPLLWGHAFINPKDTPFMTFFMASIYLGFEMADAARAPHRAILTLVAGLLLGSTISLRVLGPLAGIFVLVYSFTKDKRHAIKYLLPYFLIAGVTAYLTWPYLWKAPIANYIESLKMMSQFPFDAKVLFWGRLYPPNQVPRSYFPTLFALQLTEPVLVLFLFGLAAMLASRKLEPILLFAGWFVFPAAAILTANSVLYDNARQLYFILPPIFFTAGFALDYIFNVIANAPKQSQPLQKATLSLAVILLTALPGIFSIIQLHPYEYAYYNSLIGGVSGAYHQFETDYWGTSFKEAMAYVNSVAPRDARVLILSGPDYVARRYARPDLQILTEETDPTPQAGYAYVLILTRKNQGENRCKKSSAVYTVSRGNAIFVFVKNLGSTGQCK